MTVKDDLKARLRLGAQAESDCARKMAESKSLRQESNVERRTDLYMWPEPAQTLEGRALERIEKLEAENVKLREALQPFARASSSEPFLSIMVKSSDVQRARQALGETQ